MHNIKEPWTLAFDNSVLQQSVAFPRSASIAAGILVGSIMRSSHQSHVVVPRSLTAISSLEQAAGNHTRSLMFLDVRRRLEESCQLELPAGCLSFSIRHGSSSESSRKKCPTREKLITWSDSGVADDHMIPTPTPLTIIMLADDNRRNKSSTRLLTSVTGFHFDPSCFRPCFAHLFMRPR